jgi:hypothetical protein
MKALTKAWTKTVSAMALMLALLSAPAHAQATPGGSGAMPGADGMSGGKHRKGAEQKAGSQEQKPKVDEKDYRSAIERLPDKAFDPWHDAR